MPTVTRKRRWNYSHDLRQPRQAASPDVLPSVYFRWQGFRCRLAAAVLLVLALPLIAVLVVLVRLTSPGPGIFRQTRVGLGGRHFTMYKLRTMRLDAEANHDWHRQE